MDTNEVKRLSGRSSLLQRPNSLTGRTPDPLPANLSWVQELLDFIRTATTRLHPQIICSEGQKFYRVQFYHALPFTESEKGFLKDMIVSFAEGKGKRVVRVRHNADWVYFDIPKKAKR